MTLPWGTSDIVGGSSCLIHVPEKLGIWDPLPCKLRGSLEAGDANARLRGDAQASSLFSPRRILLACGNPLGRVGETHSPEPTEQQPAPQREPWPAPGALPRAALLGNSPGLSKPEAGAVPRGLEEGQEAGWGVRDVHAALPCTRGWEAKTTTRTHAPLPKPQGQDPRGWR